MQNKPPNVIANVTLGKLLSPEQLKSELNTLKQRPSASGYALYTTLPDAVVRYIESPLLAHATQLGVARTRAGIICVILTVQTGSVQARFIVPMLTDKAIAWLLEAAEEKHEMQCLVNIVETHQVAQVRVINPLADDPEDQWPMVKALLDSPARAMNVEEQAQELKSMLASLSNSCESLLLDYSVDELWYVLVAEHLLPPSELGVAPNSGGSVH